MYKFPPHLIQSFKNFKQNVKVLSKYEKNTKNTTFNFHMFFFYSKAQSQYFDKFLQLSDKFTLQYFSIYSGDRSLEKKMKNLRV